MSKAFDFFCLIVEVSIPWEVLLSVLIVVGGCGCPISIKVVRFGTAALLLWYMPTVSASAAEDITLRMVLHSGRIGLFGVGVGLVKCAGTLPLR